MLFSKVPNILGKENVVCFMTKSYVFAKKKMFPYTYLKKNVDATKTLIYG